jgi:hypothetical protein
MNTTAHAEKINSLAFLVGGVLVAGYTLLYILAPFSSGLNDLVINGMIALAAAAAALLAAVVWRHFAADEGPRRIWGSMALALAAWTTGEVIWMFYAFTLEEVPLLSLADLFYTGAYIFFAMAFIQQYRLIYSPSQALITRWMVRILVGVVGAALLGYLVYGLVAGESSDLSLGGFLTFFYPFGDLTLAIAALRIGRIFGRGQWGRVWTALLVFVFADAAYAVLMITGLYSYAVDNSDFFSMGADVAYFGAYILLALACLSQWSLLRFGPTVAPEPFELTFQGQE